MKKTILLLTLLVSTGLFAQKTVRTIFGKVSDGRSPIENVAVKIDGQNSNIFTDFKGEYTLNAKLGDVLVYSFQGLKTVKIKVEDVTRILNVVMVPDVAELEAVTVLGSNRLSQRQLEEQFISNNRIIRTAFGYINAETASGKVRILAEEDINAVTTCILDVLRAEFPGLTVVGSCSGIESALSQQSLGAINSNNALEAETENNLRITSSFSLAGAERGQVFIRGNSSLLNQKPAVFDIDGQVLNDAPLWIDVKNIYRIAVLGNYGTSLNYGNIGSGGVVVINTISGTKLGTEIVDQARLRNNFVSGKILTQQEVDKSAPSYLVELRTSQSIKEAKDIFEKYSARYAASPYFALDAQRYFVERWNDKDFANQIITDFFSLFENNPVLLKSLAYQYESQGQMEKAHDLYLQAFELRSNYAQSYMDLANSYRNLRRPQKAANIYNRYKYLVDHGYMATDSTEFFTMIEREYNNLLFLNRAKLVTLSKTTDLFIEEESFKGTRIVFEWNDSEAEFDLQFVNPYDQYDLFKHSLADNDALIANEKEYGFSSKEYLIDDSLPGRWKININYHGNKSLTPTYLKVTVYTDYGYYDQQKNSYLFPLRLKNVPQELISLQIGKSMVKR